MRQEKDKRPARDVARIVSPAPLRSRIVADNTIDRPTHHRAQYAVRTMILLWRDRCLPLAT